METRELLEKFKKENKPRSPLKLHENLIFELREDGYSISQIVMFFREFLKVETNVSAVWRFLQNEQNTNEDHGASKIEAKEAEEDSGYRTAADFFLNSKIEN